MSKGWRLVGWLFGGTAISLFTAYAVFLLLLLLCGRAANIDTRGTPIQELSARLVVPWTGLILACGMSYSLFKAVVCWREKKEPNQAPEPTAPSGRGSS